MSHDVHGHGHHGFARLAFGAVVLAAVALVFGQRGAAVVLRVAAALFLAGLVAAVAFFAWVVFLRPDGLPGLML